MSIAASGRAPSRPNVGAVIFTWIDSQTIISTDSTAALVGVECWSQASLLLDVTASSGTTPTLNVIIQKLLPDGSTWHDIAAFAQMTGTGKRQMSMISGGCSEGAVSDGALAAGTVSSIAFGSRWRVKAVVGGTSPSFSFSLYVEGLV